MMNSNITFKYHTIEKRLTNLENKCNDIDKKCDMILELLKDNSLKRKAWSDFKLIRDKYINV